MDTLGQWLRRQRELIGISQDSLAKAVKRTQGLVSKWELDSSAISLSDFVLVCDALRVPEEEWPTGIRLQKAEPQVTVSLAEERLAS